MLSPANLACLRAFLDCYQRDHVAIRSAVQQAAAAAIPLLGPEPEWGDGTVEQQAIRHGQWEAYLREFDDRARRFVASGGGIALWLRASHVLRESVLTQPVIGESTDRDATLSISLGMGLFIDFITAAITQAPKGADQGVEDANHLTERYRLAFEAAPMGLVMVDQRGKIIVANAETERLFGYRRDELIGQPIELLVPPSVREAHRSHRAKYIEASASRMMGVGRDLYGRRKDGSEFPVEIGLNPSRIRGALSVLAVIADITERKRDQEALMTKVWELQRSNEELEQFAYIASHDLQEPLRMVVSYTTLLSERYRGKLDEKADKFIRYAVEGGTRMQQLVADLLAYSRVGRQGKPLKRVHAQSVLQHTLEGMRTAIDEAAAEIVCDPLPTVNADESQLAQLFQNLISNALKFRGEQPPRIRIAVKSLDGKWLFSFADNGIGIEKEHAERVFQMFQRLHERGKYEGSGIGLAIAKKIVERHRGSIWYESQPGKGTTFYFTLPATMKELG